MTNKTAEEINTDKLLLWINRYLTRRFITDPSRLPEDECEKEAKVILDKCCGQIRQQVIGEIGFSGIEVKHIIRALDESYKATDNWCADCDSIIKKLKLMQQFKRGE